MVVLHMVEGDFVSANPMLCFG